MHAEHFGHPVNAFPAKAKAKAKVKAKARGKANGWW